jgi:hypothetical protein
MEPVWMKIFIERISRAIKSRKYQAMAYFDWEKDQCVMVLWPFHYLVMLVWWMNLRWCKYKHKPSWIDKQVIAAMDKQNALCEVQAKNPIK